MYFFIQGTKTSPSAILNNGHMKIVGNSTPLGDNNEFFGHLSKQVGKYTSQPANKTYIDIQLEHVNAASKRNIIDLLKTLEKLNEQGFLVIINWYYASDDEDVQELGEILASMFNFEFVFKEAA